MTYDLFFSHVLTVLLEHSYFSLVDTYFLLFCLITLLVFFSFFLLKLSGFRHGGKVGTTGIGLAALVGFGFGSGGYTKGFLCTTASKHHEIRLMVCFLVDILSG